MGAASKLFWKTLQGPEVKPVELYFGILNLDSKSNNFQKLLKKKVVSTLSTVYNWKYEVMCIVYTV